MSKFAEDFAAEHKLDSYSIQYKGGVTVRVGRDGETGTATSSNGEVAAALLALTDLEASDDEGTTEVTPDAVPADGDPASTEVDADETRAQTEVIPQDTVPTDGDAPWLNAEPEPEAKLEKAQPKKK